MSPVVNLETGSVMNGCTWRDEFNRRCGLDIKHISPHNFEIEEVKGMQLCPFCKHRADASSAARLAVQWLAEVAQLILAKNQAYGSSAENPVRIFSKAPPDEQIKVRIDDKLSRLVRGAGMSKADGEDVMKDLAGYLSLLYAVENLKGQTDGKQ